MPVHSPGRGDPRSDHWPCLPLVLIHLDTTRYRAATTGSQEVRGFKSHRLHPKPAGQPDRCASNVACGPDPEKVICNALLKRFPTKAFSPPPPHAASPCPLSARSAPTDPAAMGRLGRPRGTRHAPDKPRKARGGSLPLCEATNASAPMPPHVARWCHSGWLRKSSRVTASSGTSGAMSHETKAAFTVGQGTPTLARAG